MNVLIFDNNTCWIEQAKRALVKSNHYVMSATKKMDNGKISQDTHDLVKKADVLLIDINYERSTETMRLVAKLRQAFPQKVILLWTLEPDPHGDGKRCHSINWWLRTCTIRKPVTKYERQFLGIFEEAVGTQQQILALDHSIIGGVATRTYALSTNQAGLISALKKKREDVRRYIEEIAKLGGSAHKTPSSFKTVEEWSAIEGIACNTTKRLLAGFLSGDLLTPEDIAPHMDMLAKFVWKLEQEGLIDQDFIPIADFLKAKDANRLELLRDYAY